MQLKGGSRRVKEAVPQRNFLSTMGSIVPVTCPHYQRVIPMGETDHNPLIRNGLDQPAAIRRKIRFRLLIQMKFHNI
jgi:hypothetical protein